MGINVSAPYSILYLPPESQKNPPEFTGISRECLSYIRKCFYCFPEKARRFPNDCKTLRNGSVKSPSHCEGSFICVCLPQSVPDLRKQYN